MVPALAVQMFGVASGMTFWIFSARVVLAREEAAIALVEARAAADHLALEALRRRLEPHFLFNALNTLRATIRKDPTRARDLVSDLSDLYRYLLNHPEDAPVSSEVDHACAYLAIEKARLGEGRLEVQTAIDDDVRHARVPALTLQPLVENAVKHGVGAHESGVVRIEARREGRALIVEVHDESEGEHLGKVEAGHGIALKTLRERLTKRFGESATLELVPKERGTIARVTLPWQAVGPEGSEPEDDDQEMDAA
jgi:LytS/YehU family sensor histidine kinase